MLVFGDVHGDFEAFERAHKFATQTGLFFLSLGDLVDRGPNPFEVVSQMEQLMKEGNAGFTIGNHDDKYRRLHHGSKVKFSVDGKQTLADVGSARQAEFLRMYAYINEHPAHSALYHKFDDITLVHAASHTDMWTSSGASEKEVRSRALYGEVTGETYSDGFPIRYYNWIDEIPTGKTVIVGHDRKPVFDVAITEPLIQTNEKGGKAVFIDTGCGKGGFLTGAVIAHDGKKFKVDSFVNFQ